MRARPLAIAALAVVVAAAGVSAAVAANPRDLLLRASDFPAGAKRVNFGTKVGVIKLPRKVHGKAAWVAYRFKNGRSNEVVVNATGVVSSTSDARATFRHLKSKVSSYLYKPVRVPKYGDEQYAAGVVNSGTAVAFVIVRSGTTLWEVAVSGYPGVTKSKAVAELHKYAAKAKSRAT